jgi:hypothetical protein
MTQYWGPKYWYFLHTMINNYPETPNKLEKSLYGQLFLLFIKLIPCNVCQIHFTTILKLHPPDMSSREKWKEWGFNIHNKVNIKLKKSKISLIEFNKLYQDINHKHIHDFIVYNQIRAYRDHISFNDFILLLNLLILIHPCIKCRKSYQYRYKKDDFSQLTISRIGLEKWLKRYIKPEGLHIKIEKIKIKKQNRIKKKHKKHKKIHPFLAQMSK